MGDFMEQIIKYLREKVKPSPKERVILAELNLYGYSVRYVLKGFHEYKAFREYGWENMSNTIALTNWVNHLVVISWRAFLKEQKEMKATLLEILIHELSHVVMFSDPIHSPVKCKCYSNIPDHFGTGHGLNFSEIYSEYCNRYSIRNPDKRYYLG